jgi:hypothetical protein
MRAKGALATKQSGGAARPEVQQRSPVQKILRNPSAVSRIESRDTIATFEASTKACAKQWRYLLWLRSMTTGPAFGASQARVVLVLYCPKLRQCPQFMPLSLGSHLLSDLTAARPIWAEMLNR